MGIDEDVRVGTAVCSQKATQSEAEANGVRRMATYEDL